MSGKGKGKQIGRNAEYDLADRLSDWWGGAIPFKRMPASGALRWGGIYWTYGDMLPPPDVQMICESKVRKLTHFDLLHDESDRSDLNYHYYWQLLGDVQRAREETGKIFLPLMGWKTERKWHLIFDARILQRLDFSKMKYCYVAIPDMYPYVLVRMKDFCKQVSSQVFRERVMSDLTWCSY